MAYRVETAATGQAVRRLEFSDFRDVEGRKVPFKWSWSTGTGDSPTLTRFAEYIVTEVQFDAAIDPKVFR